jgi:amidase
MKQWSGPMKGYENLSFLDATALAELVRKKEVRAAELVEAAIECIKKINPQLNAVVTNMDDEARRIAHGNLPDGPFTGVPFLLKDLLASYKGVPMTFGTKNLQQYIPDHDSELVARYKKAGFIVVGKTNTPELGLLPTTEPRLFGPCRNPWNLNRTTGGSSGGSAAAVASGIVPAAHGNDGGGSIRIPASCCGLFGLKPTRGRNPLGPDFGDVMSGLVAEHVLTRSVRDSAAILDATMGYDIGGPYDAPQPARPYKEEIGAKPGRLRIAYLDQPPTGEALSGDCKKAFMDAVKLCSDLGHDLIEAKPNLDAEVLSRAFTAIWAAGCASTITGIGLATRKKPDPDQYESITWGLYEIGKNVSGSDYLFAVQTLQKISRGVARFLLDYDILMTPTLAEPPVELGTFDSPPDDPLKGWRRSAQFVPFTPICNATGQPAMSVPLYWDEKGLPLGTQFIGRFGDEATLFRLASQLEEARPWKHRRPPISV